MAADRSGRSPALPQPLFPCLIRAHQWNPWLSASLRALLSTRLCGLCVRLRSAPRVRFRVASCPFVAILARRCWGFGVGTAVLGVHSVHIVHDGQDGREGRRSQRSGGADARMSRQDRSRRAGDASSRPLECHFSGGNKWHSNAVGKWPCLSRWAAGSYECGYWAH
jgi:hypothetical protein